MTDRTPPEAADHKTIIDQRMGGGALLPFLLGSGPLKSWQAYGLAILATGLTLIVRLQLDGLLGGRPTLVIFTMPIMLSAYMGGLGPGLLATGLSYFLASYYLLAPIDSLLVASRVDRWQQGCVALAGVFISVLNEALHRARRRADSATRQHHEVEADRDRFFVLSQDLLCILGFDGYFKDVNPAWERTLGHTKAALLTTPFIEFVHPEDRLATLAAAERVAAGKSLSSFENRYRCDDGDYRSLQWSVTPVIGSRVMYGVARDVTGRNQNETAQRSSEARYRSLFECAPDGIVIADPDGVYLDANGGLCRMLGYTREEMIGLPSSSIVAEAEIKHIGSALSAIKPGSSYTREWQFRRKDQSQFAAEVVATKMPDGNLLAMIHDITDRKRSEARLRRLVDSNAQGVLFWNTRGEILGANDAFLRIVGYSREELEAGRAGRSTVALPEYAPLDRRSLEELAATGVCTPFEKEFTRKDGSRVPVLVGAATFEDNPDEGVSFVLDITARKEGEAALLKAGALQRAIFNSANFSSIATDAHGVIQIFNVGAERMLGYTAAEVMNTITPADISDPREVIARAQELTTELGTPIAPGFEALVFKASRGIEDIYELTYIRKDGSRFPAVVSVTALRDAQDAIIGYLLIGTDNTARKRAEEALLKAGALQSAIFNSANFSSIATDAHGVIQIFNVGAERMLGYTAAEVMNRITPADISDPREVIARAQALTAELGTAIAPGFEALVFKASRGIEDIYELTYIRKDGSRFPAVVSVTALRDAQDAIIGYLLIGTDNTARKQAEEALLKVGALQSAIFSSPNVSIIATDAKGVIQIFNIGAERMMGYTAAEVVDTITPADLHDPAEMLARAKAISVEAGTEIAPGFDALVFKAARGIEDIYELTKIRKDRSRFPAVVSVTALRNAQDRIIGYLLIGTDNTARKQIEEERMKLDQRLRDQQFYTRSLLESNIDALMTTDPRGIITDVNKQTEALTGCTRDELIGAPFKNYFTDPGRAEAGIGRVLAEGKVTNYELTARARDGALTVVSYNATTFHDRDRSLQGVFAAARDVTELKQYEYTLQQKNVELESASRMKSEFLANMSHELRTPLNAIIGFSEVLRDGLVGAMTDKQRGFIGDIFSSGNHLLALINDILDLSKVEAGKMLLELEPVQVSTLLISSLSIIREKAAARQINLDIEAGEGLGSVDLDPRKVKQIVYNLLANAVKFTPQGGRITLQASRVPRAEVGQLGSGWMSRSLPVVPNDAPEYLRISVADTGIGISAEGLEQLFRPFSQIDSGLARKFEGTGLGLAMVKLLVELHGGAVAVESAVKEGSRFVVWLPVTGSQVSAPTAPVLTASSASELPVGTPIALVVEGDLNSAGLIRVQLEAEGFAVLHATSAEAALEMAMRQPLSLITLDIMLPGMDGWEFLGRIKQLPEVRRVPVMIISIAADRNKGFALGASAVMQKPISRQELFDSLVDIGVLPLAHGQTLKVLIVDDDPKGVELVAVTIGDLASTLLRAYGGREAIAIAQRELPDVIVLDLMMPEVNGFDVVEALKENPDTARIPILVVTAKRITTADRAKLKGYVRAILETAEFDRARFRSEIRRAMSGRSVAT